MKIKLHITSSSFISVFWNCFYSQCVFSVCIANSYFLSKYSSLVSVHIRISVISQWSLWLYYRFKSRGFWFILWWYRLLPLKACSSVQVLTSISKHQSFQMESMHRQIVKVRLWHFSYKSYAKISGKIGLCTICTYTEKNRDMVVADELAYRQTGIFQNTEYNFFAFF